MNNELLKNVMEKTKKFSENTQFNYYISKEFIGKDNSYFNNLKKTFNKNFSNNISIINELNKIEMSTSRKNLRSSFLKNDKDSFLNKIEDIKRSGYIKHSSTNNDNSFEKFNSGKLFINK